jgi:hypothetical protein
MARPHIEFIQSQVLPWAPGQKGVSPVGFMAKVLSFDPDTGASTQLIRVLAWDLAHYLPVDEEFFVLKGGMCIEDTDYTVHNYGFLPAGYQHRKLSSREGAELLVFYSGAPNLIDGPSPPGFYDETRLIQRIDAFDLPWERGGQDPGISDLQAWRKVLRLDPAGQCRSFLLAGLPEGLHKAREKPMEWHSYSEEMFLISGDIPCHCGIMRPGAYFWRPPRLRHGLECSLNGFFAFLRIPGSNENVNNWVEKGPVTLTPPHRPILPPDLAELGAEPAPDPLQY